ncbi:MAG: hypothetical protein JXA77_01000 [Bacteroidales bacterium]|nr:hypothetical protein [Bacteroidales bacterium]MBN2817708.1 hypothetical protein [Bacteroidales bacterium]
MIVTFDTLGNAILEKKWQKTSVFDRDTNTFRNYYDNNNRLIKRITNSSFERVYTYDSKGNLIEEITIDNSLLIASINREFNKKNLKTREEIIRYKAMQFQIRIEENR